MEVFKKVLHQLSWQMGAKVISATSTIFLLSIITRTFGEDGTGVYTLALTYLAFFYLVADLGLNGFYLNNYSDDPQLANKIYNFRLGWSLVLFIWAIFILPLLPFATTPFILTVLIGGFTIVLNGVFNSTNFVFQHHLAYSKSSQALAIGALISLAVAYMLSVWEMPIYYFALAPLLGWLVTTGICYAAVKRFYSFKLSRPNWLFPIETLRTAWPVAATLVVNTLYFRIDSFILSTTQTFATVGSYNLAYQIFQNILVIPAFIMNGYYPLMLRSIKEDPEAFKQHFKKAIFLMIFLGVSGFVSLFYLADFFIGVLTGNGFEGAVKTLHILSTSLPAFFLSALLMWLMMAKKLYKTLLMVYLVAFLVNFLANWYFIPIYSYIAASWVTVASEYLILLLQVLILYRYRK